VFATGLCLCTAADLSQLALYVFERWRGSVCSLIQRMAHGGNVLR
jgi:hypothetical protein